MGTLTPEERRRLARARRAESFSVAAAQCPRPASSDRRAARTLRAALLLALALGTALTAAWGLWALLPRVEFRPPSSLLDWLLP